MSKRVPDDDSVDYKLLEDILKRSSADDDAQEKLLRIAKQLKVTPDDMKSNDFVGASDIAEAHMEELVIAMKMRKIKPSRGAAFMAVIYAKMAMTYTAVHEDLKKLGK